MMKKIVCLIVSALLILNTVVLANEQESVAIDVNVKVFTVETSVKTSLDTPLTLKVYKLTAENSLGELVHIWQENKSEYDGSANVYTFDAFDVDSNAATSMYRVFINNKHSADFKVVNINEKGTFYKGIAQKSAEEMGTFLSQSVEDGCVDINLGKYFEYPDEVKDSINNCLAELELPALSETPTVEELEAFGNVLLPEVERLLTIAELFTSSQDDFEKKLIASAEIIGLDMKYYGNDNLSLDFKKLCSRLADFADNGFDEEAVKESFDTASLLAIIDHAGYELVTDALKYYDDGCVNLNTAKTSGFTATQLNNLSQLMKQNASSLKDADDIEAMYVECAEEVASQGGITRPSGGSIGGGGGAGGGSSIRPNTTANSYPQAESKSAFSDIGGVEWAAESIEYLSKKGVINGKGDGKYYPNDRVTREELVKIIVEAFDVNADGNADFADVAKDSWSYSYIAKAYNAGIINGIGENTFSPKSNITRQDMAVIIYRVAKSRGITGAVSSAFADNIEIADYAKEAVGVLYNAGIINGTGNSRYSPLEAVTRAQAAKVVYELLKSIGGVN